MYNFVYLFQEKKRKKKTRKGNKEKQSGSCTQVDENHITTSEIFQLLRY